MPRSTTSRGVAVVAHGSGSTGDFVARVFGGPLAAAGWELRAVEDRTGSVTAGERALAEAVRASGAALVGGVSLGAHAAAAWAASPAGVAAQVSGLLLVLPAWTGAPGAVAGLSSLAAAEVERVGLDAALRRVDDGSWVAWELAHAWPTYGSALGPALRATAASEAPALADLARIQVPVGLVGLVGDPFHPVEVARAWCAALPRATLVELEPDAPATDRSVIGRAALSALQSAGSSE